MKRFISSLFLSLLAVGVLMTSCSGKEPSGEEPGPEPVKEKDKTPVKVKAKETPDGTYSEYDALTVDLIPGFTPSAAPETDKYGGILSRTYNATGFFRVEKIDGRWWMITPEGHPFLAASVGEFMTGGSDRQKSALSSTFGTNARWAASELYWLKSIGFTAIGRGSSSTVRTIPNRLPYCVFSNPMSSYVNHLRNDLKYNIPANMPIVFEEDYNDYLSKLNWLADYADDPYCIGIFSDNELFWSDDLLKVYLQRMPATSRSRQIAQKWLDDRKGKTNASLSEATPEDVTSFKAYCLDEYLRRTLAAIRSYDANHMFIGNRFYKWIWELASPEMMKVAGQYMDVISVNYYTKWEADVKDFETWESWSGRPFLISEFYTKGEDSGLPNTTGAGWIVPTQEDRGIFYENFVINLVKSGRCVAWQWFKYQDNDPEDTTADASNLDSNKGIVKWDFSRWDALIEHMKKANAQIYNLAEFYQQTNN